jgi:hypothetical protein
MMPIAASLFGQNNKNASILNKNLVGFAIFAPLREKIV